MTHFRWSLRAAVAGAALATAGLLRTACAAPVVMTFEGVAPPGSYVCPAAPHSEVGFMLTASSGCEGIFNGAFHVSTNGTAIYGWGAGCGAQTITLMRSLGGAFNFIGFDTAIIDVHCCDNYIDVIGHLVGGGTVIASVTQTRAWTAVATGFIGVTSVDFAYGALHKPAAHGIDNLKMEVMDVPEPGSLALAGLALGLAGITALRRGHG